MIDVGEFSISDGMYEILRGGKFNVDCLPGRICVVMDAVVPGSILLNTEPVTGIVVRSGCEEFPIGTRVIVHPEHGLQMDYRDADWIPRGADVRFYGVAVPVSESVIAVLGGG